MIKMNLLAFVLILICMFPAYCVFNTNPAYNFTLPAFNSTSSPLIVVEGTGTKFIIWTHYPSHFQIYTISGTLICESKTSQTSFEDIIWPQNHPPIVSTTLGGNLYTIDPTTCEPAVPYNLWTITKSIGEIGSHLNFVWKDNRSILTVSGNKAVYQIDLNSSQLINSFSLGNDTTTNAYHNTLYSKDLSHLYVLTQNSSDFVFTMNIWQNTNQTKPPVKQITLPVKVFPGSLSNLKESDSGLLYALEPLELSTKIYTFDASGVLTTRIIRPIGGGVIAINDGNLFDTVAISDLITNSLEVAKLDSGQTLQRIYFPPTQEFESGQYKNRVMVLLDKTGQVLVYAYENDILPPTPDDDDSGSTTWIVVICVLIAVLVIGGAAVFFIRKKKLAQKNSGTYGKLSDEV